MLAGGEYEQTAAASDLGEPKLRGADQLLDPVTAEQGSFADLDFPDIDTLGPPQRPPPVEGTGGTSQKSADLRLGHQVNHGCTCLEAQV